MVIIVRRYSVFLVSLVFRVMSRLAIFGVGVILAYVIAWRLFPAFNQRLSVASAIFWTYILSAYVLIPAGIRMIRLWHQQEKIPHFTETPDGFYCDPVNISIVGTKHQIITAMRKAGWQLADKRTVKTSIKMGWSIIRRKPYPNAPFSSLYLFGRSQDLGFQKQIEDSYFNRHHVRFWACTKQVSEVYRDHVHFWQNHHKLKKNQKLLWVGAAIKDKGIGIIRYHGQVTHAVDENTNAERDLIIRDLIKAGVVKEVDVITAGSPTVLSNRVIGNQMVSDGDIKLAVLG